MRNLLPFMVLISTAFSQSAYFRFDSVVCQECDRHAKSVVNASSFWLSESPAMDPMSKNRILIQPGFSSTVKKMIPNYWTYPNLDFAIKMTHNLAVTGKVFWFSAGNESPQVLGAGLQYFYGGKDTLNWVTSVQRVDLKGLNHFRLTSLTFDVRKWIEWNSIQFRLGAGSNFYKEKSYLNDLGIFSKLEGQINFIGLDALYKYSLFKYGIGIQIHPDRTMMTFYIQKELF